jgi:hypothetical protein
MHQTNKYYWWFQIGGWLTLAMILILINVLWSKVDEQFFVTLTLQILASFLATHLFRMLIRRAGWLDLPVERALPQLALCVLLACLLDTVIRISVISWLDLSGTNKKWCSQPVFCFTVKTLFHHPDPDLFFFHYIEKAGSKRHVKIEALVKELELKTIKSHINPHFIFNALNSIRALIDDPPVQGQRSQN